MTVLVNRDSEFMTKEKKSQSIHTNALHIKCVLGDLLGNPIVGIRTNPCLVGDHNV